MIKNAEFWIEKLNLKAHPEGGYYHETYRSPRNISESCLPSNFNGDRSSATSIYFLLQANDFSSLHRLKSDELWYFHLGVSIDIYMLHNDGRLEISTLGPDLSNNEHLQVLLKAGTIFGAKTKNESGFTLVGCMVTPGFEFSDFELSDREYLTKKFPQHEMIIHQLTRK